MKQFFLLILIFLTISCNTKPITTSMKGIKTVTETHIEPSDRFGKMLLTDTTSVIITRYNENGATESISEYDEDGLYSKYTFTRTDTSLTIGSVWGLDLMRPITEYEELIYDDNHQVIKRIKKNSNKRIKSLSELQYNDRGDVIHQLYRVFEKDVFEKSYESNTEYEYDSSDRATKIIEVKKYLDSDEIETVITNYSYKRDGSYIEQIDDEDYEVTLIVDRYHNIVEQVRKCKSDNWKIVYTSKYEYNKYGKPVKLMEYTNDEISECIIYEYEMYE